MTLIWSQVSGPATVIFDDTTAEDTWATFSQAGTYVLRLDANDGELTARDTITIGVLEPGTEVTTEEVRVAAGSDDAEESASGSMYLTSSDLELVHIGSGDQTVGIRFVGVDIPQGASIANAWVQFKVDEKSSGPTSVTIEGEDTNDAQPFTSSKWNISYRTPTKVLVEWSPAEWTSVGQASVNQQTPDISAILQEIVDRTDWISGNSLVLINTGSGKRVAESNNGDRNGAPLLHVEYN